MPPELSMSMREDAARKAAEREFVVVSSGSRIEQRLIQWLCQPVLEHIPPSVHPNTISLITHSVAWLTNILAVISVVLPQPYKSLALVAAGVCMLLSMTGDCLDGMHARNTNQCSKLGEMLDHWLDAIIVPLTVLGATLALQMDPWAIVVVNVTATMVYNGQLVLYHHTGKFVHPETTTGVEAQFGLSIGYVALGALLYYVDREQRWLGYAVWGIAILGLYIQMRCNSFYYVRLGGLIRHHLVFVGLCSAFGALYLLGAIDLYAFALTLVFTSFRVCGTYVLFTIVGRRYGGGDLGVVAFLLATAFAHFVLPEAILGSVPLATLLPYGACLYMLARNLIDFSKYYSVLKPVLKPSLR